MKQKLLNKLWLRATLLVALMCASFTGAWAETVRYTITSTTTVEVDGTAPEGSSATYSSTYSSKCQLTKGNSMTLTLSGYEGKIITGLTLSMKSNTSKGAGSLSVTAGSTTIASISDAKFNDESWYGAWSTEYVNKVVTMSNASYEIQEGEKVVITITASENSLYCLSFTLTYEDAGGSTLADNDLALTDAPVALDFDLYNKTGAQFVEYTTSSTGAVTISASDYVTTAVDQENKKIAVTPKNVTPSAQTITVSQVADENYKAGSVTFTVTITDSTPIPTHKAVFSVNGAITEQEFEEGAAIEFPATPDNIYGKAFVGWTHFPIAGTTDDAPTIYTSATMGDSDVFFYAVYAYASGESSNKSVTINSETSGVPTSYGTANTFTEYTFGGEKFQIQQMYLNGEKLQWRAAGNSSGTGTMYNSESLGKITSIVLTYNSSDTNKNFTLKVGDSANPTEGTEVTPSIDGSTYTFDCSSLNYGFFVLANGSGAGYLDGIVINYTIGSTTYTDYCTTVSKVATFSYEDYPGEGTIDSGSSYTMIQTDVRISHNKFYCSDTYPSAYFYGYGDVGEGVITITPTGGATISRIEITTTDTDHNGWQTIGSEKPGEIIPSVGEITANNEDKTKATMTTWTGSSSEQFTITNTRTIVWSSIKVYYTGGLPKCATPAISGETSFITYSTVSISCATEGATIQYSTSTDGVNYTAYQPYTGPFQVSQTTTVKAQATKEGMVPSDEAYKGFVQHEVIPNIRYFVSSHVTSAFSDPEYLLLEDALVTYKNGNTAYIEDAYGAIMLYDCAGDLEAGDKVHGYMYVTGYSTANNMPKITAFELVEGYTKSAEPEVNPTVVTLDELMGDPASNPYEMYLSKYVKIENATVMSAFSNKNCTITQGEHGIILRDQNSTATLTSNVGDNVTVTGIVTIYNSTPQIAVYEQSQIVVTAAPATIVASSSSLTGFIYGLDNGPSAAQYFTVTGTGLTDDITLNLDNNNYEMSLSEGTGYAYSLTLPQSAGTVATTTIYVRLRAGLEMNPSYSGSITIASTGATSKTVTLEGSVETHCIIWDLSKDETATATEDEMTWTSTYASMGVAKGTSSTATNNYYPGTPGKSYTSTRFYKNSVLTVTPATGYAVKKVVFEATSGEYANALMNSTWTNAAAKKNETTVTVTPKDPLTAWSAIIANACGFTSVKVYYEEGAAIPFITLNYNSANFPIAGGDGTITVTYHNIKDVAAEIVWYTDEKATVTTTEPDWISAQINASNNVEYLVDANTGAARTAYMKVYALDDDANDVYSELITISQDAFVAPETGDQYALFTGDLVEGDYVIYYDGKAMNTTVTSNRLQYNEVTPKSDIITTDDASIVWHIAKSGEYWTIYNVDAKAYAAANGTKNQAQILADGTDDKSLWSVSGKSTYEFVNKFNAEKEVNANLRSNGTYGFACYASGTGGALSLYKKVLPVTSTSLTLNAYGFATFASTEALDFTGYATADYKAWAATSTESSTIKFTQITSTVKAGTGIMISGDPGATINLTTAKEGEDISATNLFVGFTEATPIEADQYYGLAGYQFVKVGAGTVPAGKALLPASALSSSVKSFTFDFSENADGIKTMDNRQQTTDGPIYNLAGQRLQKMQKGLNIVNGKKVLK